MGTDLSFHEMVWEFDRVFGVRKATAMMLNETGVEAKYLTMSHLVVERYFGGHIPISIFGLKVEVDPFCPKDTIYYSDLPFDASLEK